jgi:hypothetical protein
MPRDSKITCKKSHWNTHTHTHTHTHTRTHIHTLFNMGNSELGWHTSDYNQLTARATSWCISPTPSLFSINAGENWGLFFPSATQSNMNSCNLQIRGKWQCFLWMVLVPTHTAHAGFWFLSSLALGMRELSVWPVICFLVSWLRFKHYRRTQFPLESFSANTVLSLIFNGFLDFTISQFFLFFFPCRQAHL